MNGELRWEGGYYGRKRPVVYYRFDADECEGIAATLSPSDRWGDELLADAAELRRLADDGSGS